jgi:hypothetical protein
MARRSGDVRKNLKNLMGEIAGPKSEKTITQALIVGGMYADLLTPQDTGNLLRSRFREVKQSGNGWIGRYGYTASYAAAVHGSSGKLKGQPRAHFGKTRSGESFGGGTGVGRYWDPKAEPEFLTKGFERDGLDKIRQIIIKGMSV